MSEGHCKVAKRQRRNGPGDGKEKKGVNGSPDGYHLFATNAGSLRTVDCGRSSVSGGPFLGSSGITWGFFIGRCEGIGNKTRELLEWNPGWARPGQGGALWGKGGRTASRRISLRSAALVRLYCIVAEARMAG